MAVFTQSITAASVLAGLTTDSTKWAGANIANLDYPITDLLTATKKTVFNQTPLTWTEAVDGTVDYTLTSTKQQIKEIGTWYFDFQFTTNGNSSDNISYIHLYEDANNNIFTKVADHNNPNGLRTVKRVASAETNLITEGSAHTGTAAEYAKTIREGLGDYELIKTGVSLGTATDTYMPTYVSSHLILTSGGGGSVIVTGDIWQMELF